MSLWFAFRDRKQKSVLVQMDHVLVLGETPEGGTSILLQGGEYLIVQESYPKVVERLAVILSENE